MKKVTVLVGMTALAIAAGCAKKEAPQAQEAKVAPVAAQPQPGAVQPAPKSDLSKTAAAMITLIDPAPQCQQYRDRLEAKGKDPAYYDELATIFAEAAKAGCVKKKQP